MSCARFWVGSKRAGSKVGSPTTELVPCKLFKKFSHTFVTASLAQVRAAGLYSSGWAATTTRE